MVLDKEAFMSAIKNRIGDDTSDEAISFIENLSDTYDDLEKRTNGTKEAEEWHTKYDEAVKEKAELEASWKQKYRDRFFSSDEKEDEEDNDEPKSSPLTFDELFEVKGEK